MSISKLFLCQTSCDRRFSGLIGFFVTPLTTLSLLAATVPSKPALAAYDDFDYNFKLCGQELLRAGISPQVAADSCAASLYPRDLTYCVYNIYKQTDISSTDALSTCRQVRRPRDLGRCVVNISVNTQGGPPAQILDNCRRSLLPVRFSECVVDLNRTLDVSVGSLMQTCIDGSDRPQDFYPPNGTFPIAPPPPDRQLVIPVPPSGPLQVPAPPIR